MHEDIQFLKDLQQELKTQDKDCQADPRFWVIGDYQMLPCSDGCEDNFFINLPNIEYYGSLDELLLNIKNNELEDFADEDIEEFNNINCELSAVKWIKQYYDADVTLIPVSEKHIIHRNTMFLTKEEAKNHIKLNHYHYSPKAHTYAMTAWRAPKMEKLIEILKTFNWDKIDT